MAKFEIPEEGGKGKPRHTKAPMTEQQGETCDEEQQQRCRDLEQEVKDAQPGKSEEPTTKEATETKAEAKVQKADAEEAVARAASAASAATTAAADGHSIMKGHAAASVGTVASNAQETKGKMKKFWPSYKKGNQLRRMRRENQRNLRKDQQVHQRQPRDENTRKNAKTLGRNQRYKEHFQYQISEKANPHLQNQKQRRRSRKDETGNRKCICKILRGLVWRWRRIHWGRHGLAHWRWQTISQPTQLHPRGNRKWDSRCHRPTEQRESERQQWNTSWAVKNCSDDTKEKSGQFWTKLCSRRTSHRKVGEKIVYRSFTRKATEKMQAITSQFVAFQFYTSCLPQYYMHASPHPCTKFNHQTKVGFGLTIDVTTTLWCTEYWSKVVVNGVYRCTSARSTSRKHSTVSNNRRYVAPCGSTESNEHTWDCCNGCTDIKRVQS